MSDTSPDQPGLLVVQYLEPGEFFVLDGNPKAGLLMSVAIEKLRGQELEEIWPMARSTGLMGALCEAMATGTSFERSIGAHKRGERYRVLRVRGLPLSGGRLLLSFSEVTDCVSPSAGTDLRRTGPGSVSSCGSADGK